ncbi:MAG: amidohydrolase family protein, partial [Candidatus Methanomethylicaceae archaeon]
SVAKQMLNQGFFPDIISSDVHAFSVHGPAYDLITTINKFIALGVPLFTVIRAVTWNPALVLGVYEYIGSLQPNYLADITVLKIKDGEFYLYDTIGEKILVEKFYIPIATIKEGQLLWQEKDYFC